jgi:hypothetical protein
MNLKILGNTYQIVKLKIKDKIPDEIFSSEFYSVTKTGEEISIVTDDRIIIQSENTEKGWKVIKILGILDFSLTGIIANIGKVLSDAEISVFAVSTYNTDYILIKEQNLDKAIEALTNNSYCFK